MDPVGTFEIALALSKHKLFAAIHKHYTVKNWEQFFKSSPNNITDFIAVSADTGKSDVKHLSEIISLNSNLKFICVDVANGYSQHFVDFVRKTRKDFLNKTIIAGNVVTGEMTEELILSGADIVKVRIGPGSLCTTRVKIGVGYPHLSAIIECADAAHGLGGQIISNGGCTSPGDVAKAFGAGADFVMLG